ncbi:efflux RND transporter periplasmic adaptor subunit [Hydrogenophaga sp. 5NK40-0174]|uniref:efflux RND transporter periplasmic adaptor subunit n=1 Tax=Hydrogenophaga sp. 5NK40-0174 TaxID=3127649 RepID=UPI00310A7538
MNTAAQHSRGWIKWTLLIMLVVAIGLGIARALYKRQKQQEDATMAAAALQQAPVYTLSTRDMLTARTLELEQAIAVSGDLKALQSTVLKARSAGVISELSKREGESVKAGEVLGRIDSADAAARVRQAEQQAEAAKAQVTIAARAQSNNKALVDQGFISSTALDNSASNLAGAQASYQAAKAALDMARNGLSDTVLRAPFDGVIASRTAENGERLGVGAPVFSIVNLDGFEVQADLAPGDAAKVQVGQKAILKPEGLGSEVAAEVTRISPQVQAGSRTVPVFLAVPPTPGMRQGMFVTGRINVGAFRALSVPLSAVRNDKPVPYLLVVKDGRTAHVDISLGQQGMHGDTPMVAIDTKTGVAEGSTVLDGSAGLIREGLEVNTPDASGPATAGPAASTTN